MEQRFSILNAILLLAGGYVMIEYGFQVLMLQLAVAYFVLISVMLTLLSFQKAALPSTSS